VQVYGVPTEGEHWEFLQQQLSGTDDFYDTDELYHDDVRRERGAADEGAEGEAVVAEADMPDDIEMEEDDVDGEEFAEVALMAHWYREGAVRAVSQRG
jgi:hypothetical protein